MSFFVLLLRLPSASAGGIDFKLLVRGNLPTKEEFTIWVARRVNVLLMPILDTQINQVTTKLERRSLPWHPDEGVTHLSCLNVFLPLRSASAGFPRQ